MASQQSRALAIARAGELKGKWPLEELIGLLEELAQFDVLVEKRRKLMLGLCITCFVLGGLAAFVALGSHYIPIIAAAALLIAGGVTFLVFFRRYRSEDIDDDLRLFVKPLLETLGEDIRTGSAVEIDCKVRPLQSAENNKGKGKKYSKGAYPSCYDTIFDRAFLTLKMRMNDDNRVTLSIKDHMIRTDRSKTNPRGKTKTKSSFKRKCSCDIEIRVNCERYACESHRKGVVITDTDKGKCLSSSVVLKNKLLLTWTDHILETDQVVAAMAGLYSCLKPVGQK